MTASMSGSSPPCIQACGRLSVLDLERRARGDVEHPDGWKATREAGVPRRSSPTGASRRRRASRPRSVRPPPVAGVRERPAAPAAEIPPLSPPEAGARSFRSAAAPRPRSRGRRGRPRAPREAAAPLPAEPHGPPRGRCRPGRALGAYARRRQGATQPSTHGGQRAELLGDAGQRPDAGAVHANTH